MYYVIAFEDGERGEEFAVKTRVLNVAPRGDPI